MWTAVRLASIARCPRPAHIHHQKGIPCNHLSSCLETIFGSFCTSSDMYSEQDTGNRDRTAPKFGSSPPSPPLASAGTSSNRHAPRPSNDVPAASQTAAGVVRADRPGAPRPAKRASWAGSPARGADPALEAETGHSEGGGLKRKRRASSLGIESEPESDASAGSDYPQRSGDCPDRVTAEDELERLQQWAPVYNRGAHAGRGPGLPVTLVCYNVLSQRLFNSMLDIYPGVEPEHAAWTARGPRIWRQICQLQPDVVCLQEVEEEDLNTFWRPRCEKEGFTLLYKKRTGGDKSDGCAVLVRSPAFQVVDSATVEYRQPLGEALDRDNVGVVVRLRSGDSELTVACTHLLYNPKRADVRLAQVALLLAEVDRLAWCGRRRRHTPVLIAGDLNLQPFSAVYRFVTRGVLQYGGMSRRSLELSDGVPVSAPLLPAQLGITHACQHAAVVQRRTAALPPETEPERRRAERRLLALRHSERPAPAASPLLPDLDGWLVHRLSLRSAYRQGGGPAAGVTTRQHRMWITVDYIFHNLPAGPDCDWLELTSLLALPTVSLCQRLRPFPSRQVPSDHLPVAARYILRPARAAGPRAGGAPQSHPSDERGFAGSRTWSRSLHRS